MVSESEEVTENSKLLYGWMAKQLRIVRAYVMEEDLLGRTRCEGLYEGCHILPESQLECMSFFLLPRVEHPALMLSSDWDTKSLPSSLY